MIRLGDAKAIAVACLLGLTSCTSVSVHQLKESPEPIVGSYPYALARTSLLLTASVTLTNCGAIQDDPKIWAFRPTLGLTESVAVTPTFEADPGQMYAVPYDQLRRVFGKETQITVTRNANGTLSGINGTVNDQYGPGAVAAIQAAVKVAAGVMVPAIGAAEVVSTVVKAGAGDGFVAASGRHHHWKRVKKTIYHPAPKYCTDAVLSALAIIEAKTKEAAEAAAKDTANKATVASPIIAKDQADIVRLQTENRLTRTMRMAWTPNGDETPISKDAKLSLYQDPVDLYGAAITDWLSDAGKAWFAHASVATLPVGLSAAQRTAALLVTQPVLMQLELRNFTMGTNLQAGLSTDKPIEGSPTLSQPAGIVLRDPAQAVIRICRGSCSTSGPALQDTGSDVAPPAAVAMGQFGRMVVFHLKNRLFENSNFSISLGADGSIASLGNHTTGTLAAGLGTVGDAGSAATTGFAAYDTALAAKNTNTVNKSALIDTLNKNLADCYAQQDAVRKAGGVPIGTCS